MIPAGELCEPAAVVNEKAGCTVSREAREIVSAPGDKVQVSAMGCAHVQAGFDIRRLIHSRLPGHLENKARSAACGRVIRKGHKLFRFQHSQFT
jgi:hypothetical protein